MTAVDACPAASSTLMRSMIVLKAALPVANLAWTVWHAPLSTAGLLISLHHAKPLIFCTDLAT